MRPNWYVDFFLVTFMAITILLLAIAFDEILIVGLFFFASEKPPTSASIATIVLPDIKDKHVPRLEIVVPKSSTNARPKKSTNQRRQTVRIDEHTGSI